MKNSSSFHIYAQNIDCGYSLEPPWNLMYNPVDPSFIVWKVGFKGVKII